MFDEHDDLDAARGIIFPIGAIVVLYSIITLALWLTKGGHLPW